MLTKLNDNPSDSQGKLGPKEFERIMMDQVRTSLVCITTINIDIV
jgi:hypothetical protein